MAAWIRRTDPSRPVHYEGGFTFDLDAAAPASDIVCPMYASPERIAAWADGRARHASTVDPVRVQPCDGPGRRPRRLLGAVRHRARAAGRLRVGVVRPRVAADANPTAPNGSRTAATSASRTTTDPSSATAWSRPTASRTRCSLELAALDAAGAHARSLAMVSSRVENRRWFTSLDDLEARWTVEVRRPQDRRRQVLDFRTIGPRQQADRVEPVRSGFGHDRRRSDADDRRFAAAARHELEATWLAGSAHPTVARPPSPERRCECAGSPSPLAATIAADHDRRGRADRR